MKKILIPDNKVMQPQTRHVSGIIDTLWSLPGDKEVTPLELLDLIYERCQNENLEESKP